MRLMYAYTRLVGFEGEEYNIKVAKTLNEVKELIEVKFCIVRCSWEREVATRYPP